MNSPANGRVVNRRGCRGGWSYLTLPPECLPTHGQPHHCRADDDLLSVIERLQAAQRLIDHTLHRPALWSGMLRRQHLGYSTPKEIARYIATYNHLTDLVADGESSVPTSDFLRAIHEEALGGNTFRDVELCIKGVHLFPDSERVPQLIDEVFDRYREEGNSVAEAMGLHLDLLTIHPFQDGNGRTSRLLTSRELMCLGHKSILTTAVEQHFQQFPTQYVRVLNMYQYNRICRTSCLVVLLEAALKSCGAAAWFLEHYPRFLERIPEALENRGGSACSAQLPQTQGYRQKIGTDWQTSRLWKILQDGFGPSDIKILLSQASQLQTERFRESFAALCTIWE